jgi:hypothetical protein
VHLLRRQIDVVENPETVVGTTAKLPGCLERRRLIQRLPIPRLFRRNMRQLLLDRSPDDRRFLSARVSPPLLPRSNHAQPWPSEWHSARRPSVYDKPKYRSTDATCFGSSGWPHEHVPTSKHRPFPQPGHRPHAAQNGAPQSWQVDRSASCRFDTRRCPQAGQRPQPGQAASVDSWTASQPPHRINIVAPGTSPLAAIARAERLR